MKQIIEGKFTLKSLIKYFKRDNNMIAHVNGKNYSFDKAAFDEVLKDKKTGWGSDSIFAMTQHGGDTEIKIKDIEYLELNKSKFGIGSINIGPKKYVRVNEHHMGEFSQEMLDMKLGDFLNYVKNKNPKAYMSIERSIESLSINPIVRDNVNEVKFFPAAVGKATDSAALLILKALPKTADGYTYYDYQDELSDKIYKEVVVPFLKSIPERGNKVVNARPKVSENKLNEGTAPSVLAERIKGFAAALLRGGFTKRGYENIARHLIEIAKEVSKL